MNKIKLIRVSNEYKLQILDYKREFLENNDSMDGTASLANIDNFEDWYQAILDNSKKETVREGLVPSSTFLAIRESDNKLLGMIDIRHELNDHLFKFGGHIGYSVRASERRKGYAKEMLKLGLIECKKLQIPRVLITCKKGNEASKQTILSANGILENEVINQDEIFQRYWI